MINHSNIWTFYVIYEYKEIVHLYWKLISEQYYV
jgi:hypothetical protein